MSETFSAVLAAGISMPAAAGILVVLVILVALYMKSRNSDSAAGQEEPAAAPAPAAAPVAAATPAPVAPAAPAAPAVQQGIPAPVVAAIAAAVQAFGGGAYTLRSVEKAPEAVAAAPAAPAAPVQGRRAWARAALAESTRPF